MGHLSLRSGTPSWSLSILSSEIPGLSRNAYPAYPTGLQWPGLPYATVDHAYEILSPLL